MDKYNSGIVNISAYDIATIEALHDILLDHHGYHIDNPTMVRARALASKMYHSLNNKPKS
jgi:hypothetical protein